MGDNKEITQYKELYYFHAPYKMLCSMQWYTYQTDSVHYSGQVITGTANLHSQQNELQEAVHLRHFRRSAFDCPNRGRETEEAGQKDCKFISCWLSIVLGMSSNDFCCRKRLEKMSPMLSTK